MEEDIAKLLDIIAQNAASQERLVMLIAIILSVTLLKGDEQAIALQKINDIEDYQADYAFDEHYGDDLVKALKRGDRDRSPDDAGMVPPLYLSNYQIKLVHQGLSIFRNLGCDSTAFNEVGRLLDQLELMIKA